MSFIAAVTTIDFPYKAAQENVKMQAKELFSGNFPQIDRLINTFDNTGIRTRNLCEPLDYYSGSNSFTDRNKEYIRCAVEYAGMAIRECAERASIRLDEITDLIIVSTTGLATPSIDALLINKLRLNARTRRMTVWGLGCAGGVSGMAKANMAAKADPDAVVVLVAIELCSLTLIKNDYSKSNFIGSSLFSDGIAACIVKGDRHRNRAGMNLIGSTSKLYYESLDIMGWDFQDDGFKVIFSRDIPDFISRYIKADILHFLADHGLTLSDISHFIFHPGGKKVLSAYEDALRVEGDFLEKTRQIMQDYGNMSSATVLYVLKKFMDEAPVTGYGLMLAMGPGFSSEMVLLKANS
jgi:alkylresorcinol/alkylpyrone synthase